MCIYEFCGDHLISVLSVWVQDLSPGSSTGVLSDQLPWGCVNVLLVNLTSEKAELEDMCLGNCRGALWNGGPRKPSQVLIKQSAVGSGFLFYDLEPDASFAKEKSLVLLSLSQQSSENRKRSWLALLCELKARRLYRWCPHFPQSPSVWKSHAWGMCFPKCFFTLTKDRSR